MAQSWGTDIWLDGFKIALEIKQSVRVQEAHSKNVRVASGGPRQAVFGVFIPELISWHIPITPISDLLFSGETLT